MKEKFTCNGSRNSCVVKNKKPKSREIAIAMTSSKDLIQRVLQRLLLVFGVLAAVLRA